MDLATQFTLLLPSYPPTCLASTPPKPGKQPIPPRAQPYTHPVECNVACNTQGIGANW